MRSWRYYRNLSLYYATLILMIVAAARALSQPIYWILTVLLWVLHQAVRSAFSFAHPARRLSILPQPEGDFREVAFPGGDGLTMAGRFAAARNRATIILAHGLGTSGDNLIVLAQLLVRYGYGVLLLDLRAHGKSQGDTSTYGLKEGEDIACAVKYLLGRLDVHGEKIGAYGISLGAQAVLRGALKTGDLRALVLEGLGPSLLSDHGGRPKSLVRWLNLPFNWLNYLVYQFMIGGKDRGVLEVISEVAPRPIFFIASGERDIYFSRLFHQAAREPKEIWELPGARHGGALVQDPNAYMDRVVGFLDRSLNIGAG
jgi:pimeloyl-ACP methyl ester carboxylesterase